MDRRTEKPEISPEDLLSEGFIEKLTQSGRIPLFYPSISNSDEMIICIIPPESVTFGDRVITILTEPVATRYESSDGIVDKGWAQAVTINGSPEFAESLRQRVRSALPIFPEPPYYQYVPSNGH